MFTIFHFLFYSQYLPDKAVLCFSPGTMIKAAHAERLIGKLNGITQNS